MHRIRTAARCSVYLGLVVLFSLGLSCTRDFEELDLPQTTANHIDPDYLFTRSLVTGSGISVAVWQYMHQISGSSWAQHWANIQPGFTWDNYEPTPGNTKWNWYYAREHFAPLHLNFHVIKLSRELGNPMKEAMARIWNVYMFHFLTDTYGDIPYSEAFINLQPAFDPQQEIYVDMINELEEAIVQIDTFREAGYPGYGQADVLYGGNADRWIRFAHGLILRLALRVSEVAATDITVPVLARLDVSRSMLGHDDTALMHPDPIGPTYHVKNPLSFVAGWNEVRLSKTMFDILTELQDPRLQVVARPNAQGEYVGLANGQHPDSLSLRYTTYYRPMFCNIGTFFTDSLSPLYLFTWSESLFLLAEAAQKGFVSGSAQAWYEQGIRASMQQMGIYDEGIIGNYLSGPAAWDASRALEQIYTQRWIALYPNGAEAWALVRQTGFPQMQAVVYAWPGNPDMPRRKPYPVNERRYNTKNYQAAVDRMGGDSQYTRIWWDGGR